MDLPVALAITGAYIASCINFLRGSGEVWFDSVVMFIFFLTVARHVEMTLRHRNQQSSAILARLLPEWCEKLVAGAPVSIASVDLRHGDLVRVRGGEAFPADAVIDSGNTEVNEALLTGESFPVPKGAGDTVIAGSVNLGQAVTIRVTATGPDSSLSGLGRLLQRARSNRGGVTGLADRLAGVFVMGVLLVALLTAAYWLRHDPAQAMGVTLAVLVVSCPCAFSLAPPAVVAAASRALLRHGVILTRGSALETLGHVRRVIFDKTGTLTDGMPTVAQSILNPERDGLDADGQLRIAAALEQYSAHPVAAAFRVAGPVPDAQDVHTVQGRGLAGKVAGREYWLGSRSWVASITACAITPANDDGSGIWLADSQGWLACFLLSDTLREGAHALVARLRKAGLDIEILSGDSPAAVQSVAKELGIERWEAGLTPEAKLERLEVGPDKGRQTLMIGDGVNDAPVLAAAGVSISVHSGTEVANSVADMILTGRSLDLVSRAMDVAARARRTIRQNLFWATAYNGVMIPMAVSGVLRPWMAAAGMSASSLAVVLNAWRLRNSS